MVDEERKYEDIKITVELDSYQHEQELQRFFDAQINHPSRGVGQQYNRFYPDALPARAAAIKVVGGPLPTHDGVIVRSALTRVGLFSRIENALRANDFQEARTLIDELERTTNESA